MYQITDNFFIHGDDLKIVNFLADLDVKLDDESNRVLTFFPNGNFIWFSIFLKMETEVS